MSGPTARRLPYRCLGPHMADLQLPPALASDERFTLLCELLQEEMANLDINAMLVYLIEVVPPQVLPHLAEQFHVMGLEGSRYARNAREQRELIKQAIELHRYKGTPWAIEQVLASVMGLSSTVSEWFEYGGRPYRFRVDVEATRALGQAEHDGIYALVREYKNARSRIDVVNVHLVQSGTQYLGASLITGETTTVIPLIATDHSAQSTLYSAAGMATGEITTIYPLGAFA